MIDAAYPEEKLVSTAVQIGIGAAKRNSNGSNYVALRLDCFGMFHLPPPNNHSRPISPRHQVTFTTDSTARKWWSSTSLHLVPNCEHRCCKIFGTLFATLPKSPKHTTMKRNSSHIGFLALSQPISSRMWMKGLVVTEYPDESSQLRINLPGIPIPLTLDSGDITLRRALQYFRFHESRVGETVLLIDPEAPYSDPAE